jgi:hypothetical protein
MAMTYAARRGKSSKVQLYQSALREIAKKGLTAERVVEAARAKASPLHDAFEWSDTKAAQEYRLAQARQLIGSITISVKHEKRSVATRAWTFLPSKSAYVGTVEAMSEEVTREEVLSEAKSELRTFRVKYGQLEELGIVLGAIDRVVERT